MVNLNTAPADFVQDQKTGRWTTACIFCGCLIHSWTRWYGLVALGQHNIEYHPVEPYSDFDGH